MVYDINFFPKSWRFPVDLAGKSDVTWKISPGPRAEARCQIPTIGEVPERTQTETGVAFSARV